MDGNSEDLASMAHVECASSRIPGNDRAAVRLAVETMVRALAPVINGHLARIKALEGEVALWREFVAGLKVGGRR